MTDGDWGSCTDSQAMLAFLRVSSLASDRKLRLFVAACARSLRTVFGAQQDAVAAVYERRADGQATDEDLIRVLTGDLFDRIFPDGGVPPTFPFTPVWESARQAAKTATDFTHLHPRENTDEEKAIICNLLRDIVGNPLRPVALDPAWLTWNDGAAVSLAQTVYDDRDLPSGHLDAARLSVLAAMLEEAGCADPDILGHLRGPGPHVRGCWCVDLLLGQS